MKWSDGCLQQFDGGPVGQEVERVPEQHGLEAGDGLHADDVGHDLGLVADDGRVADRQTVQQVHQDNHCNKIYEQSKWIVCLKKIN